MAWNAALALQYGYGRIFREYPQEVLEQQPTRYQLPVFQPTPVTFPALGQYQPHSMDSPEELAVLTQQPPRRLLAIFQPPPALVDKLRQLQMKWWPHAMDLPEAFAVLIQQPPRRLLPIFQPPPIPYPRAWRVYLDNWAAVGRKDDVLYIARNSINPPPSLGLKAAWSWQLANQAAVSRLDQILYLIQSASIVLSVPPATPIPGTLISPWATEVDNWASIGYKQQIVYLIQSAARAKQDSLPPFHPSIVEEINYASIGRMDNVVYQARNLFAFYPPPPPLVAVWGTELANWASIGYKQQITYLIQLAARALQNSLPPFHPSIIEAANYAAIGRLDQVLYWARNLFARYPDIPPLRMAWRSELANWAALIGGVPIAISLVKPYSPLDEAVQFIPSWKSERDNLASIHYKQPIVYLIQPGFVVLSPFVALPPPAIIAASFWSWKQYYLHWSQTQFSFRLPAFVGLPGPPPVIPPVITQVDCFTIEAPPTSTLFALGDALQASMFLTESGLLVIYTGESPHICFQ